MPTAENREDSPSISSEAEEIPDLKAIMSQLEYFGDKIPRDAINTAIANSELVTQALLQGIQNVIDNPNHYVERKPGYYAHVYAMCLLAQIRETRAYPLVAAFASLPDDLVFDLAGDFQTEALGRVLASVCCGDQTLIRDLLENQEVNEYVRSQAAQALVVLAANGMADRADVLNYFKTLLRSATPGTSDLVYEDMIYESLVLYPDLIVDDIREAFANGLVPGELINLEEFEKRYALGPDVAQKDLQKYPFYKLIDDTVQELERWACFDEDIEENDEEDALWSREPTGNFWDPASHPIRNDDPKVSPNDPCPCDSGKKYKKCCGR